jgi:SAM-dependent methyltransferase
MSSKRARLSRWLDGDGIEIGALHRPLEVPRSAHVTYVDHLNETDLRRHYPELAEAPLTRVDVIGSAEDLSAFDDDSQDFVIANHLVEHLEYPIRGLLEFQRVLKPGGLLYLALPDQRVTFDDRRELTTVQHLLEENANSSAAENRRAHYLDWAINVDDKAPGDEADAHADDLMARHYSIHFHTWRPDTFLDFLIQARAATELNCEVLQFAAAEFDSDDEFCLLLAKAKAEARRLPPVEVQERLRSEPMFPEPIAEPANKDGRPAARSAMRRRIARSPLGPPARSILRMLGR